MKRFWKRVNRGLVLAAVILVGLVIFIQIDQYQFKSSKPEIEQMTREYLERVRENNQLEPKARMEQTRLLLTEYWKDSGNVMNGVSKRNMESYLDYVQNGEFEQLDDYADRINDIEISKSGPRAASVSVSYEVTLEGSSQVSSYSIYGLEAGWYEAGEAGDGTASESRRYDLALQMTQESDGWKITSISSSYELAGTAAPDQES